MAWWNEQAEAWLACRTNLQEPAAAIQGYALWLRDLPGKPVFVADLATSDFMFVDWYLQRFAGRSPFALAALDSKTLARAGHEVAYAHGPREAARWFESPQHTHVALQDALAQGALFCKRLAALSQAPKAQPTLERAIAIASAAHAGQFDKSGQPYILHPLRVMLQLASVEQRIAAVLHDVVEDTHVTMADLAREGFSELVLAAVAALTKQPGESRMQAAARAAANPIACAVKLADNTDNMDLRRIPNPTARDYARLEEYKLVRALLLAAIAAHGGSDAPPT